MQGAIKEARKNVDQGRKKETADNTTLTKENLAAKQADTLKIIDKEFGERLTEPTLVGDVDQESDPQRSSNFPPPAQSVAIRSSELEDLRQSDTGSRLSESLDDDDSQVTGRTDETKRRLKFQKQPAVSLVALLFTPMKHYTASVDHSK